ncbi:hypothetical protein TRVL_04685 [Trypanosoma vivax]|nr:hypothetical protein TRVL_04685 [Trypanosoma vivax]
MENAAVRDLVHRAVTSMTDFADLVKHFKNKMSLLCDAAENATAGLSEAAALVADKHETDIKEAVQSVELELRALMEEMKRDEEVMMEVGREVKEEVKKIDDSESEGVSISGNADKAEEEVVGEGDVEARTKAQPSVVSPRAEAQKASATPNTFETETDVGNEVISDARKAQHTMRRTALIAVAVVVVVMSFVGLAAILHRQLATKSSNVLV